TSGGGHPQRLRALAHSVAPAHRGNHPLSQAGLRPRGPSISNQQSTISNSPRRRPLSIPARSVRIEGDSRHNAGWNQGDGPMKQYLLSVYQPDGPPPPPESLQKIMRDVYALRDEMKSANVWVFSGGLHDASTATVLR